MLSLNEELLKEWALNSNAYLMPQDEELFLANETYFEIILKTLDDDNILENKRNILLDALCILIYDNSNDKNLKKDEVFKNRVITVLNKRKHMLDLAGNYIPDYIKEVVYPQLNNQK